jgi:hypothetical protein
MREAQGFSAALLRGMPDWLNCSDDMFCDNAAENFSSVGWGMGRLGCGWVRLAPLWGMGGVWVAGLGVFCWSGAPWRISGGAGMVSGNTICLGVDGGAEDAGRFFADANAGGAVHDVFRVPSDYRAGKEGDVLTVALQQAAVCGVGKGLGHHRGVHGHFVQAGALDQAGGSA